MFHISNSISLFRYSFSTLGGGFNDLELLDQFMPLDEVFRETKKMDEETFGENPVISAENVENSATFDPSVAIEDLDGGYFVEEPLWTNDKMMKKVEKENMEEEIFDCLEDFGGAENESSGFVDEE